MNIVGMILFLKFFIYYKDYFIKLVVEVVFRLKGFGNLEVIYVIKKLGGSLVDFYLDEGFFLDKKIGVN